MIYLLDSNACIRCLRNDPRLRRQVTARSHADIRLCSVVLSELYRGAIRSANPSVNRARVDAFAAPYQSLPFDNAAAEVHATIRVHLERQGQMIGPYDLQIAAIALFHNLTLVTHNTSEFSRVTGLMLEDWELP